MKDQSGIYILSNDRNTVLYVGVSSNIPARVWQHKNNLVKGFTQKYNVHKLVYYETIDDMESAITREKQLKGGSRKQKENLINKFNPEWEDLYESIV